MGNVKERGRLGDHPHEPKRSAPQASCSASERWGEAAGSAKRSLTATGTTSLHVFCQALSAGDSSPASKAKVFGRKIPIRLGTGQQLATVAQTSIRGLATARTCVVAGLPRT